jgi:hypothetical protein
MWWQGVRRSTPGQARIMVSRYRGFGYHRRRLPERAEREAIIRFTFALWLAQLVAMLEQRIEYDAGERG